MTTTEEGGAIPAPDMEADGHPRFTPNKLPRILMASLHSLHVISNVVVLVLAVYLLKHFPSGAFEKRLQGHSGWAITLASIDLLFMLPILIASLGRFNRNFLGFITLILGAFWLTLVVYILKDFTFGIYGLCEDLNYALFNGPPDFARCKIKRALTAFTALATLTNFLASLLYCVWWFPDDSEDL
ncbi:hypothetical protein P3342_013493 [Pyrenophora teres f. teres]|uniref:MARVEL domain-containing protein n=1 Tax=Pyrenophora teres f. teres (strain 0-1) TaxID=861557 RepID=E3RDP3_PYRTT|nr:hypothetical protein PTT_02679 [Pyrenophora teres f. teres 0-1]KAK1908173.1 hypothetical protein P3342_013493 [Pyrenophora teres f. teres]